METPLLTYLVTKRLATRAHADRLAAQLPARDKAVVEVLGPRDYRVKALIDDVDFDAAVPLLGRRFGTRTYTTPRKR